MTEQETNAEGMQFLVDSVGVLTADDVDVMLRKVPPPEAMNIFRALVGNKLDPARIKKPGGLIIGPLRKRSGERLVPLVDALSSGVLASFETELGERFEDPSSDDLREVLDAVLAEHPVAGVRCTLSSVVAQEMPAAAAARTVLLSDPRLRLDVWPAEGPAASG